MKKNIVFIPNISVDDGSNLGTERSKPYHYSVKSWTKWAEQFDDIEVIEWKDPIMDPKVFPIIYQREWVFDILDHNKVNYDQVLIVDADTIVHPDCPNFFKETNHEYSGVVENGCYEWVTRSINGWGHFLNFPKEIYPKTWKYFNTGFIIANAKHKEFFNKIKDFYTSNIDELNDIRNNRKYQNLSVTSTGQTLVNFLLNKHNIKRTILPECYNFNTFFTKNLLHVPNIRNWFPDKLIFLQGGWVYHFAAIPDELNRLPEGSRGQAYWMKRTYEHLYIKNEEN